MNTLDSEAAVLVSPQATKFNIGDVVWIATESAHSQVWVTCPDCLGQKFLTVITGDGSKHTIDCECCKRGYEGCVGQIHEYQYTSGAYEAVVNNIEVRDGKTRYNYQDEENVFAFQEQALKRSEEFRHKFEASELNRLTHCKEHSKKSWAWHVTYHRRELKRAQHYVEYHASKLNVAKSHAKE